MAMSRSLGGTSFTTRSPMVMRPLETVSSPAIMRSVVLLPHPDGPTRTTNSPSATSSDTSVTAAERPPSYILETCSRLTPAIVSPPRSHAGAWLPFLARRSPTPVSRGFSLGCVDVRLSDRGCPPRRRRRAEHLAPLLALAGVDEERRHRRRRLRPLPSVCRRRRVDPRPRPQRLSVQHLLVPHSPGREGRSEEHTSELQSRFGI